VTTQRTAAKLTCGQTFFFCGAGGGAGVGGWKREKKRTRSFPLASKTKREEGPADRRLLQIRVVHRRFFFSTIRQCAEREKIKKGTIFSFSIPFLSLAVNKSRAVFIFLLALGHLLRKIESL